MARKSAASLSVIAGSLDQRPGPPAELTAAEAEVWEQTVAHEAADVFGTAALQQLLEDYGRHVVAAERLSAVIEKHLARAGEPEPEADEEETLPLPALDRLLKMRDRETKAIGGK